MPCIVQVGREMFNKKKLRKIFYWKKEKILWCRRSLLFPSLLARSRNALWNLKDGFSVQDIKRSRRTYIIDGRPCCCFSCPCLRFSLLCFDTLLIVKVQRIIGACLETHFHWQRCREKSRALFFPCTSRIRMSKETNSSLCLHVSHYQWLSKFISL